MNWKCTALLTVMMLAAVPASAEVTTKRIEYRDGDAVLVGHLAWDDAVEGERPGVLVVHEWWGLNDYARRRAEQLAAMGYVAFALDMYGEGKVTEHPQQAGQWASEIRENTDAWRQRARAGLDILRGQPQVDSSKLAAIGYCFGGSTVLQMAYSGEPLRGVVSFHGALPAADQSQVEAIKARILVCHGSADAFIPDEQIQNFQAALQKGKVDWQMIYYGGARHSFTNPDADDRGIENLKYDKDADQRSWAHMKLFFSDVLK